MFYQIKDHLGMRKFNSILWPHIVLLMSFVSTGQVSPHQLPGCTCQHVRPVPITASICESAFS